MSYFSGKGLFQDNDRVLCRLVAVNPSLIENPRKNKDLQRYVKASIAYYDLFNNGLGNANRLFGQMFFSVAPYKFPNGALHADIYAYAEEKMDQYVSAAYKEQFDK